VKVLVGTAGFPASKKKVYSSVQLVELQTTFYNFPKPGTAARWRAEAPEGFVFTLKASQLITHPPSSPTYRKAKLDIPPERRGAYGYFRPTPEVWEAWERTLEIAHLVEAEFIVFQTPASFSTYPDALINLREFFSKVDSVGIKLGLELRGKWDRRALTRFFKEFNLIHVVDPFKEKPLWGDAVYYRLHGRGKGYTYDYSKEELLELKGMLNPKKLNYVVFNNTQMLKNAVEFLRLLQS